MSKQQPKLTRGYKNNKTLLKLLEHLYLYGAFTKDGVTRLIDVDEKTSERYLLDLIYNFGEDHILHFFEKNRKYYYAGFNYYRDLYNYLMKAYYLKTVTQGRLQGYFHVLHVLNNNPKLTAKELLDCLSDLNVIYNDSFIRDLANDMVEHGIISTSQVSNRLYYALTQDTLRDLTDEEVLSLYRGILYFSNTVYPFAVGDLTMRNLEMYLENFRKIKCQPNDFIHVINKGFHLTLYEESVIDILKKMDSLNPIPVMMPDGLMDSFFPELIHLDYESTELMLLGSLQSGVKGSIHLYSLLHQKTPVFLPEQSENVSEVILELNVTFSNEEFIVHRLMNDYPKSKIRIASDALYLDITLYNQSSQIEIVLQELPLLKSLVCEDIFKQHLKEILLKGVETYANEQ